MWSQVRAGLISELLLHVELHFRQTSVVLFLRLVLTSGFLEVKFLWLLWEWFCTTTDYPVQQSAFWETTQFDRLFLSTLFVCFLQREVGVMAALHQFRQCFTPNNNCHQQANWNTFLPSPAHRQHVRYRKSSKHYPLTKWLIKPFVANQNDPNYLEISPFWAIIHFVGNHFKIGNTTDQPLLTRLGEGEAVLLPDRGEAVTAFTVGEPLMELRDRILGTGTGDAAIKKVYCIMGSKRGLKIYTNVVLSF